MRPLKNCKANSPNNKNSFFKHSLQIIMTAMNLNSYNGKKCITINDKLYNTYPFLPCSDTSGTRQSFICAGMKSGV